MTEYNSAEEYCEVVFDGKTFKEIFDLGAAVLNSHFSSHEIIPEGRLQPLKDLMDPYLKKNGRMEFGDFYDYWLGRNPEPKVRIKHLHILMKTMNFIFYGSLIYALVIDICPNINICLIYEI